jgi:TolA-binding protein
MPVEDFRDEHGNPVVTNPQTYPDTHVAVDPVGFTPEERERQRLVRLPYEVRRLYIWFGVLTGLSVIAVGLLSGFVYSLKKENDRLSQQVGTLDAYKAQANSVNTLQKRVDSLESQTTSLSQSVGAINQQVPKGLQSQIKGIRDDVTSLRTAVQGLASNAAISSPTSPNATTGQTSPTGQSGTNSPSTPSTPPTTR